MINMKNLKAQSTFEFTSLQVGLLIITVLVLAFFYYYFSVIGNSITSTNLYSISSIYFYPSPGQSSQVANIYGTLQISVFSPKVPGFSSSESYLIQKTNSSFASNCNIPGISAFSSNGYYCVNLPPESSELPEGNDKYLLEFTGIIYNTTAYTIMNSTEPTSIIYYIINLNGKYAVQKINPPVSIQIN